MKQINITNKQQIQQLTYEELSDETESLRKFFSKIEKFFNAKSQYHYHEYFGGIIETTEEEHKAVAEKALKDNSEIILVKWITEENPLFFDFLWIKWEKRCTELQDDCPNSIVITHLLEYLCMFPWKIGFLGPEIQRFGKVEDDLFFKENQHLFIVDKLSKSYDHSNSNDNLICPICMEYVYLRSGMAMTTCCGKVFHNACLHQWTYDYSDKCPNCRAPEVQGYRSGLFFIFAKSDYEH